MSGDGIDCDGMHEELPFGQTAPVVGSVVPPTGQLHDLSEGDRASGLRVEPNASLAHAILPVFGSVTRGEGVNANTGGLSGAGLSAPAGPDVGAAGVAGTGAADAPGDGPDPDARGQGPGTGAQGPAPRVRVAQGHCQMSDNVTVPPRLWAPAPAPPVPGPCPMTAGPGHTIHLHQVCLLLLVHVPEVFASLGISADEYEQLSTYMKAVKMTPPDKWVDDNGRDVAFFLTELKSFNVLTGLPKVFWGMLACMYLSCKVHKSWDQEIRHLQTRSGKTSVDWDIFEVFMRCSIANMLPAHEARRCYDKLSQTGSVKDYVRELVQVVRELEGTPYHPGGSVFDDFIKGLKSVMRRFVLDHAPTGLTSMTCTKRLWTMRSMVWLVAGLGGVVLNVPTSQMLADLVTLVSVTMQERNARAPLGVLGAGSPRRAVVQGVTLTRAVLGAEVAGPRRAASGS